MAGTQPNQDLRVGACSFLKKRTKRLLIPRAGGAIRDLAGAVKLTHDVKIY
jgi:hypothetical protein